VRGRDELVFEGRLFGYGGKSSGKKGELFVSAHGGVFARRRSVELEGSREFLPQLRYVSIVDGGKGKKTTVITIGYPTHEAGIQAEERLDRVAQRFREMLDRLSGLEGKFFVGPPPVGVPPVDETTDRGSSRLDELERLARLFQEGLVDQAEYDAMKQRIIDA